MALGFTEYSAHNILSAYTGASAFVVPAGLYVKMHTGPPGAAGTSNPAANTTRLQFTGSVESGGAVTNTNQLLWTAGQVVSTENWTNCSLWDAPTGGNCLATGLLTPAFAATLTDCGYHRQ